MSPEDQAEAFRLLHNAFFDYAHKDLTHLHGSIIDIGEFLAKHKDEIDRVRKDSEA